METNTSTQRELLLEVQQDGCRRLIYRTKSADNSPLFVEESNLVDFSRPFYEGNDFNVFFTERAFWKSFIEYTSLEGFSNRQVWHEATNEWLDLRPVFVHNDIKHLIQESLSDAIRNLSNEPSNNLEGIRIWLRALSNSKTVATIQQPFNTLRYAV